MSVVYKFDIEKYKNGEYQLVSALNENIHYIGRFVRHDENALRKTKVNTVQFDWPNTSFGIFITNSVHIEIRLKGRGNYFNVFINGKMQCIVKASLHATCCEIANDLDPSKEYHVVVTKRTEPQMRGALSTFKICTFYGFLLDATGMVLPNKNTNGHRKIEFIGDSDTCAFGNEGEASSASNFFNMKGRLENVHNGFASIVSRMLDAESNVLAWSGKGVHSNSLEWGPTMCALWKRTLGSREGLWDMQNDWIPNVVVVHLGGNDLLPPASSETEIIESYTTFIEDIRHYRPNAHIFCVVCDEGCISSEDSLENRLLVSHQLQEIVKVAISRVSEFDDKLHYTFITLPEKLQTNDYGIMMHYSVSGHIKFAQALAPKIADKMGWSIVHEPSTMPYPPEKKDILAPSDSSPFCTIS